jgi:NAD(P)-dependent dehydrogenase (short-subunit alcohol dehydrogenase family)
MKQVIVISGASSGFGALAARALAHAGHTVYATMRETTGRNAPQVAEVARYASEQGIAKSGRGPAAVDAEHSLGIDTLSGAKIDSDSVAWGTNKRSEVTLSVRWTHDLAGAAALP